MHIRLRLPFSVLLFLLVSQAGCQQPQFDEKIKSLLNFSVPIIRPAELRSQLKAESKPLVIDARTKEEYEVSHIEGALFIPWEDAHPENYLKSIPKNSPLVVYCSVGYRSEKFGERLKKLGYSQVKNLYGGIFLWNNEGYPMIESSGKITSRIHGYDRSWSKWITRGDVVID